jgi:N-methylhydantoinase A/oxoprolinase/acetone carboxylase beta subunit
MYIIIDFINNAFHLKNNESIPGLHDFYGFCQSIQIENLDEIVKIMNLSFSYCCILLLFGYITPEAEKEIKKQLKTN